MRKTGSGSPAYVSVGLKRRRSRAAWRHLVALLWGLGAYGVYKCKNLKVNGIFCVSISISFVTEKREAFLGCVCVDEHKNIPHIRTD